MVDHVQANFGVQLVGMNYLCSYVVRYVASTQVYTARGRWGRDELSGDVYRSKLIHHDVIHCLWKPKAR